jgi:hypothetical protein
MQVRLFLLPCLLFCLAAVVQTIQAQPLKGKLPKLVPFKVTFMRQPPDTLMGNDGLDSQCVVKRVEVAFRFRRRPILEFNFYPTPLAIWMNDNLEGKTACQGQYCLDSLMALQLWGVLFVVEDEKGRFRLYASHLNSPCVYMVPSDSGPSPRRIDTLKGQLDGGAYLVRLDDIRPHPESKKLRMYYAHKVPVSGLYDPTKYSEILLFRSRFIKVSLLE